MDSFDWTELAAEQSGELDADVAYPMLTDDLDAAVSATEDSIRATEFRKHRKQALRGR
jgi:hypothetical protein